MLFHELACDVCGSDLSEAMLEQARVNLAELGVEVAFYGSFEGESYDPELSRRLIAVTKK